MPLGLCKNRLFSLIAFVTDKKVLGQYCDGGDGQTYFGMERIEGEGTEGQTDRLRAFVTGGKVLGQNCDGRTCFGTEMGMENLAEDGNQDIRTKTKSVFKLDSTAQCVTC